MDTGIRFQILGRAGRILHNANAPRKGMHPAILPSIMGYRLNTMVRLLKKVVLP